MCENGTSILLMKQKYLKFKYWLTCQELCAHWSNSGIEIRMPTCGFGLHLRTCTGQNTLIL